MKNEFKNNFKIGTAQMIIIVISPIYPKALLINEDVYNTLLRVSDKQFPTIGTKFATAYLAVFIVSVSPADDTKPESANIALKTVRIKPVMYFITLIINFINSSISLKMHILFANANIISVYNTGTIILLDIIDTILEKIIYIPFMV